MRQRSRAKRCSYSYCAAFFFCISFNCANSSLFCSLCFSSYYFFLLLPPPSFFFLYFSLHSYPLSLSFIPFLSLFPSSTSHSLHLVPSDIHTNMTADEKNQRQQQPRDDEEYDIEIPAGIAPEAYYDSQLSPLRASLRRFLLPYIRAETPILHSMQVNQPCSFSLLFGNE